MLGLITIGNCVHLSLCFFSILPFLLFLMLMFLFLSLDLDLQSMTAETIRALLMTVTVCFVIQGEMLGLPPRSLKMPFFMSWSLEQLEAARAATSNDSFYISISTLYSIFIKIS